ncbi:hypothetical protein TELCIR_16354, partial [Teladorsagia circumcincta]
MLLGASALSPALDEMQRAYGLCRRRRREQLPYVCYPVVHRWQYYKTSCARYEFACVKSGRCILAEKRCDGIVDDCGDGSNLDEIGCGRNT